MPAGRRIATPLIAQEIFPILLLHKSPDLLPGSCAFTGIRYCEHFDKRSVNSAKQSYGILFHQYPVRKVVSWGLRSHHNTCACVRCKRHGRVFLRKAISRVEASVRPASETIFIKPCLTDYSAQRRRKMLTESTTFLKQFFTTP